MELWTWNWYGGGWNQCMAPDKNEAMRLAKKMGGGHLHPIPQSLRRAPPLKIYERHEDFQDYWMDY